nr:MAG TPA: hypothetical protein [Caudoviricetes sp.]
MNFQLMNFHRLNYWKFHLSNYEFLRLPVDNSVDNFLSRYSINSSVIGMSDAQTTISNPFL